MLIHLLRSCSHWLKCKSAAAEFSLDSMVPALRNWAIEVTAPANIISSLLFSYIQRFTKTGIAPASAIRIQLFVLLFEKEQISKAAFHRHVCAPAIDVTRWLLNVMFNASRRDGDSLNSFSTWPASSPVGAKTKQQGSSPTFHTSNLNKNPRKCKSLSPQIHKYNNRINKPMFRVEFVDYVNDGNPKSKSLSSSCPSTALHC